MCVKSIDIRRSKYLVNISFCIVEPPHLKAVDTPANTFDWMEPGKEPFASDGTNSEKFQTNCQITQERFPSAHARAHPLVNS